MVPRINFDAVTWPVNEALFWIFLSDEKDIRLKRRLREEQFDAISEWLDTEQPTEKKDSSPPSTTFGKLNSVRKNLPKVSAASPLLWIRFAFSALRDGITPSSYFFTMYANWRFNRSRRWGAETISRIQISHEEPTPIYFSQIDDKEIEGALFDRFFLEEKPISESEWNSEWEFLPVSRLPHSRAPRTDIREHVGRKVFQRLEECIAVAAKEGRIDGLSKQRKNQKYTATISRAELADALQRRYGKRLACQTNTIVRALSHLVACRKKSN